MKTLRNTMPPGDLVRKLLAEDSSRFSSDPARRDLPEATGRIIKVGPARIPSRPLTLPRH